MRLARLDMLRYGRFTDEARELPRSERDIHIVYGPNEAGKTTCLTAIEDLLFGIPQRSPYNFLHSYDAMRVGALLENGDERLDFQRRKGRRDTILGPDGAPLPGGERLLAPFLGGADRAYFDRMFNLSHSRLAEGGKTILEAKDDVGQMLFAAGTGLADVRERLKRLEKEADRLWAPRKSAERIYYQARDRLDAAISRQREHSLTVNAWRKARKTLSDSEKTLLERREEYEETSKELKKLIRIRRVYSPIRRQRDLIKEIAELGNVIELPEDAFGQLDQAVQQEAKAKAQIDVLAPQLKEAHQKLEAITFDESLVRRAEDIVQLSEQRIAVRSEREDLPRRRDEYRLELESLARLAAEIGWDFEESGELIERIPSRSDVELVRSLMTRHGKLAVKLGGVRKELENAQAALQDKTERLTGMGTAKDVSGLVAVVNVVKNVGDVTGRIRATQGKLADITESIAVRLRSMTPFLPASTNLETLALPPRDTVVAHRDDVRNWASRQKETKKQLTDVRTILERDQEALELRERDEGAVSPDAVRKARSYRDTLWNMIKTLYIERSEIPTESAQDHAEALQDLPASLEGAVERADSIADRRFDKAHAAGEVAVLARNITGHKTQIRQLKAKEESLKAEGERLDQAWQALWAEVPIEALPPDVMLAWLEARGDLMTLFERKRAAQRQLTESKNEEREAIAQVRTALTKVGLDPQDTEANELRVLVELADSYRREQEAKTERIVQMGEAVRAANSEVARRQNEVEQAEREIRSWRADWATAVAAIDLKDEGEPDIFYARIKVIDEIREHATKARELRDKRIATIERDIDSFEQTVTEVTSKLAPDLTDDEADASVVELDRRREEAMKRFQEHREESQAVAKLRRKIEDLEEERKDGWSSVQPLLEVAGVDDFEKLHEAIERSDKLRTLRQELASVMETLHQQGDGLEVEVLEEECWDVDIDAARGREEAAETELRALRKELERAIEVRSGARNSFEAIGGDDVAAKAAADCEEARATMLDAAERYARVRASAILLRWAVDRYRKEKQGPLLKRAGELFRVLTRRSFDRLQVKFDERDAMHLTGVRLDGEEVAVPGLSTGTEDQLFLALRIAAVEDYLARAVALPFVADDLFINFDLERSAAGFEVLGQLAERTQVLFYTHHLHLVDIARDTLGADVNVVSLADPIQPG